MNNKPITIKGLIACIVTAAIAPLLVCLVFMITLAFTTGLILAVRKVVYTILT